MKTKITFLSSALAVVLLVLAISKSYAFNYTIQFTASGVTSSVGSVQVQNLNKGTTVTVPDGNTLTLTDQTSAVDALSADDSSIRISQNASTGTSTLTFYASQVGSSQVTVYALDGRKVVKQTIRLEVGDNSFELSLPAGMYVVRVSGTGYAYSAKLQSQRSAATQAYIKFISNKKEESSVLQKSKATSMATTTMSYTAGNQLLYTATSGTYIVSLSDIPTGDKTTNFVFTAIPVYESLATISPLNTFGDTIKYHMLDLNGDPDKAKSESTAKIAFGDKGMNGVRFPLYCGDYYGGHPAEGVVVESVYARPLKSLENAKKYYSGSDPFMIFVGIKVMTSDPSKYFPDWVTTDEADVANPVKYAQLLVDFIEFMQQHGHVINAIAFDKESVRLSTDAFKEAVDTLRARTKRLGYVVPKIVYPELMDPNGDKPSGWMNTIYKKKGYQDRFDIFGDHYYQRDHTESGFADLKYEYDLAQSDKARPFWATEPHWDGNADIYVAESAIGCMFDMTDLGLEAFMWWSYPITGSTNVKGPIMRAFSDAIHHSIPIRMNDHDGEETFTKGKLQSRAYLRGKEVNVFLINVVNPNFTLDAKSYKNYPIGILDGFKVDGNVIVKQWREDTGFEGEIVTVNPIKDNQFLVDIPTGSFTQLTFKITE